MYIYVLLPRDRAYTPPPSVRYRRSGVFSRFVRLTRSGYYCYYLWSFIIILSSFVLGLLRTTTTTTTAPCTHTYTSSAYKYRYLVSIVARLLYYNNNAADMYTYVRACIRAAGRARPRNTISVSDTRALAAVFFARQRTRGRERTRFVVGARVRPSKGAA